VTIATRPLGQARSANIGGRRFHAARTMSADKKNAPGFTPLKASDDEDGESVPLKGTIYGATAKKKESTPMQQKWARALAVNLVVDMALCVALYEATHNFSAPWTLAAGADDGEGGASTFTTDTLDLVFLGLIRTVSVGLLTLLTLKFGIADGGKQGLLPHQLSDNHRAKELRADRLRMILLMVIFSVGTVCSVYTGIKCIMFDFSAVEGAELMIAPFLGSSIFMMNAQFVASRRLVGAYVKEAGAVLSALHVHALKYYTKGAPGRTGWGPGGQKQCDVCRTPCASSPCYNCQDCNFNLCIECFETKSGELQGDEEENVVRGDKGKQKKLVLSNWGYFTRAFKLVGGQGHLIFGAMSCLLVSSAAGVILPNYQGVILDEIIKGNPEEFQTAISLYLAWNFAQVLFGTLRQICFSVVGRRIGYKARNVLFCAIVRQDIAFFDGMTTGQLTARLGQDLQQMLMPLQWALSQLLQSALSLVGGLFMCLLVSWKLSMLAFTSIFPVIVITQVRVPFTLLFGRCTRNKTRAAADRLALLLMRRRYRRMRFGPQTCGGRLWWRSAMQRPPLPKPFRTSAPSVHSLPRKWRRPSTRSTPRLRCARV
jgi:hypothetical protein